MKINGCLFDEDGAYSVRETESSKNAYDFLFKNNSNHYNLLYRKYRLLENVPDINRHPLIDKIHFIKKIQGSQYYFMATTRPEYIVQMSNTDEFYSCFKIGRERDDCLVLELLDPNLIMFCIFKYAKNKEIIPYFRCTSRVLYKEKTSIPEEIKDLNSLKFNKPVLYINRIYGPNLIYNMPKITRELFLDLISKFCNKNIKVKLYKENLYSIDDKESLLSDSKIDSLVCCSFINPDNDAYYDNFSYYEDYLEINGSIHKICWYGINFNEW